MGIVRQNLAAVLKRLGAGKYIIEVEESRFGKAEKVELEAPFMDTIQITEFLEAVKGMENGEIDGIRKVVDFLFDYLYPHNPWNKELGVEESVYKNAFRSFITSHLNSIMEAVIDHNLPEAREYAEVQEMIDKIKERRKNG